MVCREPLKKRQHAGGGSGECANIHFKQKGSGEIEPLCEYKEHAAHLTALPEIRVDVRADIPLFRARLPQKYNRRS